MPIDNGLAPVARDTVERLAYRPQEAAAALGISKSRVYELMATGQLHYRQVSTQCRLVPRAAIDAYLAGGPDAPA